MRNTHKLTRQDALYGCIESEIVCVHFFKINSQPYNGSTLAVERTMYSSGTLDRTSTTTTTPGWPLSMHTVTHGLVFFTILVLLYRRSGFEPGIFGL